MSKIFYISIPIVIFVTALLIFGPSLLKSFDNDLKQQIKKYILPYRYIKEVETSNRLQFLGDELSLKEANEDLIFQNNFRIKLFNSYTELYKMTNLRQLTNGIDNLFPGSGFIDIDDKNLYLLSSAGIFASASLNKFYEINEVSFRQISTNLNNFINYDQYIKNRWFSFKDLLISEGKVFVSYTKEVNKDCWNTSFLFAELNKSNLIFKNLFSPEECVNSEGSDSLFGDFNAKQSGGRMVRYDEDHILVTTGEFRARDKAQSDSSVMGKILKINLKNGKNEIISMGHRNPQGLLFNVKENFILSTEHGPQGGDEINFINLDEKVPLNFGWPISSYGQHYLGPSNWVDQAKENPFDEKLVEKKYELYPLHKSHSDYGFVEPLKYFERSPGLSEVVNFKDNKYIASSLKFKSIYTFILNKNQRIENLQEIYIGERIRDMINDVKNERLLVFLEDTSSIGIIAY